MKVKINPSTAQGSIVAPPSKSVAHRALICAALSGESTVENIAPSRDVTATLNALEKMGAQTAVDENCVTLGGLDPQKIQDGTTIFCDESGSTLRFLLPLCMLSNKKINLIGASRLFERPLSVYEQICAQNGIEFEKTENGVSVCGRLKAGNYTIRGDISSQFITGLLFALPQLSGDSTLEVVGGFESEPYANITVSVLKDFGIYIKREKNTYYITGNQRFRSCEFNVEGDMSNAAFLDGFNLLGGSVDVQGLSPDTLQGDRAYMDMYKALKNGERCFDLSQAPDLAPVMFALAAVYGDVTFTGTARLKIKESDRACAMAEELSKFGVRCEISENSVRVFGGQIKKPTEVLRSHNDHRIVMALSLLLSKVGGEIDGAEAVAKSYPDFFKALEKLNIGLEIYDN